MVGYSVGVISAQVSGLQTNVFQLNTLVYILQFVAALCCFPCQRYSIKVSREHLSLFVGAIISNIVFLTSFLFAASFMPVGNLDAFFVAVYLISTTCFDLYKNSITKKAVLFSAFTFVGIVIMAQPWNITQNTQVNTLIPCDYLGYHKGPNHTSDKIHQFNETKLNHDTSIQDPKLLFGIGLILTAGVACTFSGNILKFLTTEYTALTAMFWITLFQGILLFCIHLVWVTITRESYVFFPEGRYCRMFTIIYVVSIALENFLTYLSFRYIPISTVAMSNAIASVALYVCQRTFLSAFHPGHANLPEVLGLFLVIFGTAIMPVIFLLAKNRNKEPLN